MNVREIMTTSLVTATDEDSVAHALRLLEDQMIRHLPIVDGKRLLGMVSDRDLREYRLPLLDELDDPERADDLLATPLSAVMRGAILSVEADESVATAIDLMVKYGIGAIPVTAGDDHTLLGIVSYVDVLEALRPMLDEDG